MTAATDTKVHLSAKVFMWRVTSLHIITYFVFGILFYHIFSYDVLYGTGAFQYLMRPTSSVWVAAGPSLQVIRGLLLGCVLWLFKDVILLSPAGWLKLWLLLIILGVVGTATAGPGSIEGLIYTKLSLAEHLIGLPEVIIQAFVFSFLLYCWYRYPARWIDIVAGLWTALILLMSIAGIYAMSYGKQKVAIKPLELSMPSVAIFIRQFPFRREVALGITNSISAATE